MKAHIKGFCIAQYNAEVSDQKNFLLLINHTTHTQKIRGKCLNLTQQKATQPCYYYTSESS